MIEQVAADKQMLENELKDAQAAFNARYAAGKAPSKRFSQTITRGNPSLLAPEFSDVDGEENLVVARNSITAIPEVAENEDVELPRQASLVRNASTSQGGTSRKNSTARMSTMAPVNASDQIGPASRRASSNPTTDTLLPRASLLGSTSQRNSTIAPTNAYRPSLAQQISVSNSQRASLLTQNTVDGLLPSRAPSFTQANVESASQRPSALAQRVSSRRPTGESLIPRSASLRRPSSISGNMGAEAGATTTSRRSSTAIPSRKPSSTAISNLVQGISEAPSMRNSAVRASTSMQGGGPMTARASRRSTAMSGGSRMVSGGVGQDQLQEKLEILETEIREANAKRNTLLASNNNNSGFFNANSMGLLEGVEMDLEPVMGSYDFASGDAYSTRNSFIPIPVGFEMPYGPPRRASTGMLDDGRRRSSSMFPSIPAEAGGGSRNSTRSRSSQGSRSGVVAILSLLRAHPV